MFGWLANMTGGGGLVSRLFPGERRRKDGFLLLLRNFCVVNKMWMWVFLSHETFFFPYYKFWEWSERK
jgi:hypothetical protein